MDEAALVEDAGAEPEDAEPEASAVLDIETVEAPVPPLSASLVELPPELPSPEAPLSPPAPLLAATLDDFAFDVRLSVL